MKSPYRALIWEQARICFPRLLGVYGIYLLILLLGNALLSDSTRIPYGEVGPGELLSISLQVVAGMLIVLYRDNRDTPGFGFSKRHLAIPVTTVALTGTIFFARVVFLTLLSGLMVGAQLVFSDVSVSAAYIIMPLLFFVCLQAWAWAAEPLRGYVWAGGIVFLFSIAYLFDFVTYSDQDYWKEIITTSSFTPVVIGLLCYLLGLAAVRAQRHDKQSRIPTVFEAYQWLISIGMPVSRKFDSPLDALLWYERRRVGRQLFLLFPLLILAVSWLYLLFYGGRDGMRIPFIALFLGAFAVGNTVLRAGSYVTCRPVTIGTLANAKLLAQAYALFLGLCWLLLLFTAIIALEHTEIVTLALNKGVIDLMFLVALILRPVLLAGCLAWLVSWLSTRLVALTLALLIGTRLLLGLLEGLGLTYSMAVAISICVTYLWCLFCIGFARWQRYLSSGGLFTLFIVWGMLFGLTALASWMGSTEVWYVLGLFPLMCLPLLAVPEKLQRLRVG